MDKPETTRSSSTAGHGSPNNANEGRTDSSETELCPTILLTDIPETADKFEGKPHQRVAQAIAELIQAPEPEGITIGLEGSWGAGKTTIIHLLKADLKNDPNIKLIQFDAWAHEGDPLRWTFLERLVKDLTKDKWVNEERWNNTLEELANRREVTTVRDVPMLKWLGKAFAVSLLLVPIGAALFGAALDQENITLENTGDVAWLFLAELVLGLAFSFAPLITYLLFKIGRRLFGTDDKDEIWQLIANKGILEKRTETNKTANPTSIEFGSKFELLMAEALKGNDKRIVLIVDNLDRVDAKEALSIWSTLQTFLQYRTDRDALWSNRLWLLALYDLKGLSMLWEADNKNGGGERGIGDVATSFMDKNFQIRFEVPPPVLSDWRSFLMGKLKDAFPKHDDTDFHQAYRVLAIHLDQDRRLPTIRELKLYVNQIGAIHRQWAARGERRRDAFPLAHIAYYVMLRRKGKDVINELKMPSFPPKEYRELLGDGVRDSLAAIVFNVEVEVAQQLLITNKVKDALSSGSPRALKDITNLPRGTLELLERIITTEWQDAEAVKIADAAYALNESGLLEKATRPEAKTIIKAMCRTASKVEAWIPLDELKARGISTLLKWKQSDKNGSDYTDYLNATFRAISLGLTEPPEDFSVSKWLQSLLLILNDLQAGEKIGAYSEIADSIAGQLRADNLPKSRALEAMLEVLSEFQSHLDAQPAACKALADLTEGGHMLHQLASGQERTTSATAWCLYLLLKENRDISKPSPGVGLSNQGYDYLTKIFAEPIPPVVEKFTEIIARYKKLDLLFELASPDAPSRGFAIASLKVALAKDDFTAVFEAETFAERLNYIRQHVAESDSENEAYNALIRGLLKDSAFMEKVTQSNFDPNFAHIYEDMASHGANADKRFKEWSRLGLQSVSEDEWLEQLENGGAAPRLAGAQKQSGIDITLGKEFRNAIASWAQSFTRKGAPAAYSLGFYALPFDLLGEADRKELSRALLDVAAQSDGGIHKDFFTIFGEEIAPLLKENLSLTEGLFTSILRMRHPRGLRWIASALEDTNNQTVFAGADSLKEFKRELKGVIAIGTHDTRMTPEVVKEITQIAEHLKVELLQKRKIAFAALRDGKWDIFTMDEDGGNETQLTDFPYTSLSPMPPQANHPTWSPDGKRIAFSLALQSNPGIYIIDANGENQTKLISRPEGCNYPAWSPDGKRIAFTKGGGAMGKLCVVDIESRGEILLISDERQNEYPSWSPDGRRLAFHSVGQDGNFQINIINSDGTGRIVLSSTLTNDVEPQWSPDGSELLFRSTFREPGAGKSGLYLMDLNGANRKLINPDPEASQPVWSPDGKKIAYVKSEGIETAICVMNADGTNIRRLTKGEPRNTHPSWQPGTAAETEDRT